jgi:hypothetical protein
VLPSNYGTHYVYDGTRSTVDAALGGLDIAMPGPGDWWSTHHPDYFGAMLVDAVGRGQVPMSEVDNRQVLKRSLTVHNCKMPPAARDIFMRFCFIDEENEERRVNLYCGKSKTTVIEPAGGWQRINSREGRVWSMKDAGVGKRLLLKVTANTYTAAASVEAGATRNFYFVPRQVRHQPSICQLVIFASYDAIEEEWRQMRPSRALALAMSQHSRLGAASPLRHLPANLISYVLDLAGTRYIKSIRIECLGHEDMHGEPMMLRRLTLTYTDGTSCVVGEVAAIEEDSLQRDEFALEAGELLTGCSGHVLIRNCCLADELSFTSITFHTSRGRASPMYGCPAFDHQSLHYKFDVPPGKDMISFASVPRHRQGHIGLKLAPRFRHAPFAY